MTDSIVTKSNFGDQRLNLLPDQKVILIAAPGGAGKTTTAARIAKVDPWVHISEDRVWDELPRDPHTFRTEAEKAIVQSKTVEYVKVELNKGHSVVLEFIVYDDPPQPIIFYQSEVTKLGVPVHVKVLRPSVDELLARQAVRANAHDTERELSERRANAEHQVRCLSSGSIDPNWVVNSTGVSLEDVYQRYFANIVEQRGKDG
jgi:adenylate kinase family enzyme